MGKIIAVIGNTGVGKTTLVRLLEQELGLPASYEEHGGRPFQSLFQRSAAYALANQVDYLLLRASQEQSIRSGSRPGLMDGGMEMDLHIFSRLFLHRNYLSPEEFSLLERLYTTLRSFLPPPDLFVFLDAPPTLVLERYLQRNRELEIATTNDIVLIDDLLKAWVATLDPPRLLTCNASHPLPFSRAEITPILQRIESLPG